MTKAKNNQALVINGRATCVHVPSALWLDNGLGFAGVPWKKQPDLCVLHWTAAENPPEQVYRTLKSRRLSVHFCIGKDGTIYQFCDPALTRCAHCGPRGNDRAIGIEVVSYGWHKGYGSRKPDPLRPSYRATIHGWQTTVADYLSAQYEALFELARVLHETMDIEASIPLPNRRLTKAELDTFRGFCGHYHVDRLEKKHPKIDPGPRPLKCVKDYLDGMNGTVG